MQGTNKVHHAERAWQAFGLEKERARENEHAAYSKLVVGGGTDGGWALAATERNL
jgi:hypothetical protein